MENYTITGSQKSYDGSVTYTLHHDISTVYDINTNKTSMKIDTYIKSTSAFNEEVELYIVLYKAGERFALCGERFNISYIGSDVGNEKLIKTSTCDSDFLLHDSDGSLTVNVGTEFQFTKVEDDEGNTYGYLFRDFMEVPDKPLNLSTNREFTIFLDGTGGTISDTISGDVMVIFEASAFFGSSYAYTPEEYPVAVRTGYTFNGWYTDESGGVRIFDSSGAPVLGTTYWDSDGNWSYVGDVTFYAQWTVNQEHCISIHNGTEFVEYMVYIHDGVEFNKYIPYIYDGTVWVEHSS